MTETTKQNISILAITVLMAGSVFIFFNFINPAISDFKEIRLEIKETQEKIKILKEYKAKAEALIANYINIKDEIEEIHYALPDNASTGQVLAVLDEISKKGGISINSLSFNERTKDDLGYLEIRLSFVTTYDVFRNWLKTVEGEMRLIDLERIEIKGAQPESGIDAKKGKAQASPFLVFNINLLTYYQKQNGDRD